MKPEDKDLYTYTFDTPLGHMTATASDVGLRSLVFCDDSDPKNSDEPIGDLFIKLERQLQEYFLGERRDFDIPLDLMGTDFQKKVWKSLLDIPYGKTISYSNQADILGNPKAIRAIASANGKNPISILIPCHRVIGSNGSLTGYAGGLERKKELLLLESPQPRHGLFAVV